MRCAKCNQTDTKVIESRDVAGGQAIRRRRECLKCGFRYTTYERVERPRLVVVKRDGTRQSFDRDKILSGIDKAAEKTSITALQREEMVNDIEQKLYATGEAEAPSTLIGELVMNALADADDVAYVRFASVYRHFTSIQGFQRELDRIKERAAKN